MKRLVVLISGGGSNLQALLDAIQAGELEAEPVLVVSNKAGVYGLERAQKAGVPTLVFPLKPYKTAGLGREKYDADLAEKVAEYRPDVIVLAGWMHILSPAFLNHFPNQVLNLHPALPGQFVGTHAIERAFEAYQKGEISYSGCMVHLAIPEVDAGPVVAQAEVAIEPGDTLESFSGRMHQAEHRLIVEATKKLVNGL